MKLKLGTIGGTLAMAAALALAPVGGAAIGGESVKETARQLVDRHKDAVVLVEVVVNMKLSAGGQSREQERKFEANGTVITAEGLTVVSNASVDPTAALERMRMKADVSTSDVKIVTADGTELEAEIVLTDKDLDLAFVRPKAAAKLPCVELKKGPEPALLDTLVSITRLGRKANREPGAALSEVLAVIHKPRTRYLASGQIFQGCPVFTGTGELLGLALMQTDGAAGITVLPCEDVLEAFKQIGQKKEAKGDGEEAKPEAKAPPVDDPAAGDDKGAL